MQENANTLESDKTSSFFNESRSYLEEEDEIDIDSERAALEMEQERITKEAAILEGKIKQEMAKEKRGTLREITKKFKNLIINLNLL